MTLEDDFIKLAERAKKLNKKPSDEILLKLYSLYKQATVGPNNTSEPSFLDFTGKAKWNAWKSNGKMSKEEAMKKYVYLVERLTNKN